MRFLSRALGLFLSAAAFVAFVIDATRSIGDQAMESRSILDVWAWLSSKSLAAAGAAITANLSPVIWNNIIRPVFELPFFACLLVLAGFFLFLGRKPRSRIGYVTRG